MRILQSIRSREAVCAECLKLRRWALSLLAHRAPTEAEWADASSASERAWTTFLRAERCAVALQRQLDGTGDDRLAPSAATALAAAAGEETIHILSARAQVRAIGAICAARGWPMLVLKGGALVGSDAESVDVADLDVLVRPEHALPLAAVLEASGYRKDGIDPGPEHGATAHLATRKPPWGVQVDVHFRVNGIADAESLWAAAEPLAGHPGVLVLRPGAQLHHLLLHTGTQHFNRRGTLRDLLLLASAAARCTPAEMTEVRRAISAHPAADLLSEMLKSALRLRGGGDADDPYRSVVLANYWIHAAPPSRHVPAVLLDAALLSLFSLLAPGDSYRRAFRARLMAGQLAHAPGFGVVHRISPRAAAAIQTAGRAALMAAVALPAWAGARRIAALAKGTGRTGDSE